MHQMITPEGFPNLPYLSPGTVVEGAKRWLFVSGQVGVDGQGRVGEGIVEQARLASRNLLAVLGAAGMDKGHIAKVTIYLTDASLIPGFMQGAAAALAAPPPATTLLVVKALAAPDLLVEIEAVAAA